MDEEIFIAQNGKLDSLKIDFQNLNYEKRKEFDEESSEFDEESSEDDQDFVNKDTCPYVQGDLVWVNVKGYIYIWPAMITIPQNEPSYTKSRLKKSTKKSVGPKQYHVQLFCDNYRTMWVSSKTIFIYNGFENLRSYCEKLKLQSCNLIAKRILLKACSKLSSHTNSSKMNPKSLQWNQAVLEADQVLPLERYERILKFKTPLLKEKLYQTSGAEENYVETSISSPMPSSIDLELVSPSSSIKNGTWKSLFSTCDSSDEFSGFEDDYSMEERKSKRCNSLKRLNQRSQEDLLDVDFDVKHEIEIKEEPLELCDKYPCHENESIMHQKQTLGNYSGVISSLKPIGEELVTIEVDNEDKEVKNEFFSCVENDREFKIEIQRRLIEVENLGSKVKSNILNHDSHVDEETLFRRLENSEFPEVVSRSLNVRSEVSQIDNDDIYPRKQQYIIAKRIQTSKICKIEILENQLMSGDNDPFPYSSLENELMSGDDDPLPYSSLENQLMSGDNDLLSSSSLENQLMRGDNDPLPSSSENQLMTGDNDPLPFSSLENKLMSHQRKELDDDSNSNTSEYIPSSHSSDSSQEISIDWKMLKNRVRPTLEAKDISMEVEYKKDNVSQQFEKESSIIISTDGPKQQCCLYCEKVVSKIGRHYIEKHRKEKEVFALLSYPIGHKQRKLILDKLRLEGNFRHNINVLKKGFGILFVARRSLPDKQKRVSDYIPCTKCLGFFNARVLWKHYKMCKYDKSSSKAENVLQLGVSFLEQHVNNDSGDYGKAFTKMRKDEICKAARDDYIINKFCINLEKKRKRFKDVSNKVRELGRFILKLKLMFGQDRDLKSFLRPSEFDCLKLAAKELSYSSDCSNNPSMFCIKIGQSLKKCCSIVKVLAIKNNDLELKDNIEGVETLLTENWTTEVDIPLRRNLEKYKLEKKNEVPLTDDLAILSKHIKDQVTFLTKELKENTSMQVWRKLACVTLANLILFNKRRKGDVGQSLLTDYIDRPKWQDQNIEEIQESLSKTELAMQAKLDIMKIRGKRGRRVPILLTVNMKEALDILLKTRTEVGILEGNPYLFANSKMDYLRGGDALASCMNECKVERKDLITSSRLCKYVATVSQIMNFGNNELDWLANHLGHDINIHREYYRLQDSTIEMAKVSKLLLAVDQGMGYKIAGKSLDQVNEELNIDELLGEETDLVQTEEESEENNLMQSEGTKEENLVPSFKEISKETPSDVQLKEKMRDKKCFKKRQKWEVNVKRAALEYFKSNIKNKKAPKQMECLTFLEKYGVKNREWKDVKTLIYNEYRILR